jgi:dTMP kinase
MDVRMGTDLYDSFVRYQAGLIGQLDRLAADYGFDVLDATRPVDEIHEYLWERVSRRLATGPRPAWSPEAS